MLRMKMLEMTRRIRDMNYQRTQGMTHAQRLAFYKEHAAAFHAQAKALLQNQSVAQPARQPASEA